MEGLTGVAARSEENRHLDFDNLKDSTKPPSGEAANLHSSPDTGNHHS